MASRLAVSSFKRVIVLVGLIVLLIGALRAAWMPIVGEALIVADPLQKSDAVAPLAGEWVRVTDAVELFEGGDAQWLALTNMREADSTASDYLNLVRRLAIEDGVPPDRIATVPDAAGTTYEEARLLRQLADQRGWHSLIVVTSPYHTRRARMILRHAFRESSTTVIVRPSRHHWYVGDHWWTSSEGRRVTLLEYVKLVLFLVGYHEVFDRSIGTGSNTFTWIPVRQWWPVANEG